MIVRFQTSLRPTRRDVFLSGAEEIKEPLLITTQSRTDIVTLVAGSIYCGSTTVTLGKPHAPTVDFPLATLPITTAIVWD